jgi:two-component system response regulator DegU
MGKTKVMIIDEQSYFRAGVKQTLLQEKDFEVVEAAPNNDILGAVESKMPDIVLLGSDLAAHKGLELGGRIARNFPSTRVVILSPNTSDEELFNVIRTSAVACLAKNATPTELIGVIRRASRGEYPINDSVMTRPTVARQVLREFQEIGSLGENIAVPLTQRERQILTFVADGNTNKQIAGILDISEQTIKNHVSAILRKLNANDRAHAVVLAIRRGWISLGETKAEIGRV